MEDSKIDGIDVKHLSTMVGETLRGVHGLDCVPAPGDSAVWLARGCSARSRWMRMRLLRARRPWRVQKLSARRRAM